MIESVIFVLIFLAMLTAFAFVANAFLPSQESSAAFLKRRISSYGTRKNQTIPVLEWTSGAYKSISPYFFNLSQKLYSSNQKYMASTRRLLITANRYKDEKDVFQHFAFSLFIAFVAVMAGLFLAVVIPVPIMFKLIILLTCIIIARFIPDFGLRYAAKSRKMAIYYTLSDILDLLVVCMESGMGLDASLMRVSNESATLAPELTEEIQKLLFEVSSGIARTEAFRNMAERTDVGELASLAAMLIQADKFGTSLGNTIKVFSDDLRQKRRLKAEELASKASIKMTFPLVLLIFPPLFMIMLGPSILTAMDMFSKK